MDGKSPGPGPRNLITDVPGLRVGQAHDAAVRTGVTVILPDARAVCAADVRGGAPGTRETDALAPENLVDAVDAVVLSGGSVYGLAAADGVVAWLGARGRGFGLVEGIPKSPVVPGAILFDMANGGDKGWGEEPPHRVIAPGGRTFWAAPFELGEEFGGLGPAGLRAGPDEWGSAKRPAEQRNTTIACVATDAVLTPAQAKRVAVMAQDGFARAIRPVHAPFDGDVVFAVSTGVRPLAEPAPYTLARLGALAADCLARAVARGVFEAKPWPGAYVPCWRDLAD
ncbi:P1 family peptidase [Phenylobacterium sp. CCH12-B4]|uniref:P1 family peptidase n=1 Tax=Phenylobacterium sp. CCH12-B4 TaxID=1768784 RepID=UPI00083AB035|nr:P1 family peptidase [Phenylobacterium sp. CCH12-B4]